MNIESYGWGPFFAEAFERLQRDDLVPGRVIKTASGFYQVVCADGETQARRSGKLSHEAESPAELPTVGDWVALRPNPTGDATIEARLDRSSILSRRAAGKRNEEQAVAANVDVVFVVMGLDGDFSPRRLERYVATVHEGGARPVVLLNKTDVCEDLATARAEATRAAPGVTLIESSFKHDEDLTPVLGEIGERETAVLVGSSGAGKSTLINRLLGESVQRTREVREGDDRGRHTTTHRELFRIPGSGMLIDSPGIRELQLWGTEDSLDEAFDDIVELALECRFRDCGHVREDGCAVLAAVESGALDATRLESFRNLQKELRYLEQRQSETAQRAQKQKWRSVHRELRRFKKHRKR